MNWVSVSALKLFISLKKDKISAQAIICACELSIKIKYKGLLGIKYKWGSGEKDM